MTATRLKGILFSWPQVHSLGSAPCRAWNDGFLARWKQVRLRDCGILGNSWRLSASISSLGIWWNPSLPHRLLWEYSERIFIKLLGQARHLCCYTVSTNAGSPLHVHVNQSTTDVMRRVKAMQGGKSERKKGKIGEGKERRKEGQREGKREGR